MTGLADNAVRIAILNFKGWAVKMKYFSVLCSKGRSPSRKKSGCLRCLGLKKGDRLEFVVEGDRTVIRPARVAENPFEKYAGVLGTFPGGKAEINRWLADLRSEDSEAQ